MKHAVNSIRRFLREEAGANGVEYSLLAGLIAIAFVVGATALGGAINTFLTSVSTCVQDPTVAGACNPFGGG